MTFNDAKEILTVRDLSAIPSSEIGLRIMLNFYASLTLPVRAEANAKSTRPNIARTAQEIVGGESQS